MKKKVWLYVLFLFVFILLFILFLPSLASTPIGKKMVSSLIARKTSGKIHIEKLHLRWFGPQKIEHLDYASPDLNLTFDSLATDLPLTKFFSLSKKPLRALSSLKGTFDLKNAHAILHYPNYPEAIFSGLNAQIKLIPEETAFGFTVNSQLSFPTTNQQGSLAMTGKVKNPSSDFSNMTAMVTADIKNFPAYALKAFFPKNREALAFLGEKLNLTASINLEEGSGPVLATIDATGLKGTIDGKWQKGLFLLDKPLLLQFHLTPEISKSLLSSVSPFFLTGIEAKNPIDLRIEPNGFVLPYPFDLQTLQIEKGSLDMGKILCQNGSSLNNAIGLMKLSPLTSTDQMEVWFTSVDFSLESGVLRAGRMDFLVSDTLHLCSWGSIDLVNDQLNMILGITNDAMETSFGIQGMPDDYVLQIPVKGTRKNPKINLKEAGAKIAALLALQTAGKKIPFGGILGGVFGKVTEPDAPPPKRPFPWEGQQKSSKSKSTKPLDQLQQLFKN